MRINWGVVIIDALIISYAAYAGPGWSWLLLLLLIFSGSYVLPK